jgi:hypothetical protein
MTNWLKYRRACCYYFHAREGELCTHPKNSHSKTCHLFSCPAFAERAPVHPWKCKIITTTNRGSITHLNEAGSLSRVIGKMLDLYSNQRVRAIEIQPNTSVSI